MAQDEGPQGIVSADDMTGRESYYTEYAGNQIMFHVSTLLPYAANDPQQARPSESARGTSGAACVHGRAAYGRADCAPPPRTGGRARRSSGANAMSATTLSPSSLRTRARRCLSYPSPSCLTFCVRYGGGHRLACVRAPCEHWAHSVRRPPERCPRDGWVVRRHVCGGAARRQRQRAADVPVRA